MKPFLSVIETPDANALCGKRCWLYSRTANDSGNPLVLEIQLEQLRSCAGKYGMTITGEVSEVASGMTLDRVGFNEVMTAARNDNFDVLLVKELGRISRDYAAAFDCLKTLEETGVVVVLADNLG